MSEVVVRMEMPHDGLCDLAYPFLNWTYCTLGGKQCNFCDKEVRPDWCPILCALPKQHGRLIDASTVIGIVQDEEDNDIPVTVDDYLCLSCPVPTIVPATERSET